MSTDPPTKDDQGEPRPRRSPLQLILLFALGASVVLLFATNWDGSEEISFSELDRQIKAGNVAKATFYGQRRVRGEFRQPIAVSDDDTEDSSTKRETSKAFVCKIPEGVGDRLVASLQESAAEITAEDPAQLGDVLVIVSIGLLVLLIVAFWTTIRRSREQMLGGGMLSGVVKSPARRYDVDENRVIFDDVAGLEGVKQDLQELVDFLADPEKFQRLGARVPKGVLLMGPPGTGKTLLARAVAGEAGVPFFSINGSEFIQLFVGVGAGRVRDMFKNAKQHAPAILFIDEIDAVGRQRGAGLGGGHDEREQTLNQILSEMDGFTPSSSVIVVAATNRPDVLDPALLRPGRFDRHVAVDRPTVEGRKQLFEVHARDIPVTEEVDFDRLARACVGLTGADIRNLVNEAALWATRHDKDKVDGEDFEYARDKVLMGGKREEVLTEREKQLTAYHEAGHAVAAWMTPSCERVHKVTIVPRGRALGVTQLVPDEDRHNFVQGEIEARLVMGLAGRTAEKLVFNEYSAGAENDLKEATSLARRMVMRWGMSESLGPVSLSNSEDHPFLGRDVVQEERQYSEKTAEAIDAEVSRILHEASERARRLLEEHRDKLEALANALLDREILDEDDIAGLIGGSVNRRSGQGVVAGDAALVPSRAPKQPSTAPPTI